MKQLLINMDFWGSTTSLLCAIHCIAFPFLISFGLLGYDSWLTNPLLEFSFIFLTTIFVYNSLLKGYFTGHVGLLPFSLSIFGLILIASHHFFHGNFSIFAAGLGGISVAIAHFINLFDKKMVA